MIVEDITRNPGEKAVDYTIYRVFKSGLERLANTLTHSRLREKWLYFLGWVIIPFPTEKCNL